jgi:dsDNA-binding SOS-regulon protein
VRGRRSYAEVLGLSSQTEADCFNSFLEPIARVPRWLKEASAEMDRQAKEEGKIMMAPKYNHAPAKYSEDQVLVVTKTQQQLRMGCSSDETGGCKSKNGGIMRELVRAPARNLLPQAKHSAGMSSSLNNGTGRSKGQEEAVNLAG